MSISRQRATDLVGLYDRSLEQQILGRGSNLACRDEELCKQVEGLLRDRDAQEMHCLDVDPLRVMEESLKEAVAATSGAAGVGRVKATGRLQGLAKAFEVLEQAALNLYLGPWREEYKVVKMYSGMFTHNIKPVLAMQQVEKLFGLLGYKPGVSSRPEQLQLHPPRVASLNDLLRLSCAFFLARCECRLLLTALGKHAGEVQWELGVVRERQSGNNLQVSLENTKRTLEVNQPQVFDGELDVDLYTDKPVNGAQRELDVNGRESELVHDNDGSPHSLIRMTRSSEAVKQHSNGVTSMSSSMFLSAREPLPAFSLQPNTPLNLGTRRQGRLPWEQDGHFHNADSQPPSLQGEAVGSFVGHADSTRYCSCVQSPNPYLKLCIDCNTFHDFTCALLNQCDKEHHNVVYPSDPRDEVKELRAVSPPCGSLRASDEAVSPTLTSISAAMSSFALRDDTTSLSPSVQPITYHDCCDLSQPDPNVLCFNCSVFHSSPCGSSFFCQAHHTTRQLGVCLCGEKCPRKPLVLCRYCGKEYCTKCWYRNPVKCHCGQTFDQSSAV